MRHIYNVEMPAIVYFQYSLGASHNKTALCEDFMKLGDINLHMNMFDFHKWYMLYMLYNMFDFHKWYMLYKFRFGRNPRWRPPCSQTLNFALSYVRE